MASLGGQRKKEILLGVILVLLAFALWQNLSHAPGAGGGAGAVATGGRGPGLEGIRVFPVEWAALTAPRPGYDPSGRNIFQFGATPPPPPPRLSPEEEAAIRLAQQKAEEERQKQLEAMRLAQQAQEDEMRRQQEIQANLPPPPPPKPQPPPVTYKFIGYIGPPERKIAVLHDGADLLFVRQGEEVGKGFKILEIGYESIKFGYTDPRFRGESQTLPMSSSY